MEFDFYKKYQTLSDAELLHICNNPSKYQPRAVEDARRVLEERSVDIASYVAEDTMRLTPKKPSELVQKIGRIFEETIVPEDTWDFDKEGTLHAITKVPGYVVKWHWALVIAYTLISASNVFGILKLLVYYFKSPEIFSGIGTAGTVIYFLAISLDVIIVIGLYKRKAWAWSILFCSITIFFGNKVGIWYGIFMDPYPRGITDYLGGITSSFELLYYIGLFILLNKSFMRNFYKVTDRRRTITALVASAIFIIQQVFFYWARSNNG